MSFWTLLQILVNLILLAGLVALWIRSVRPPKDDPRLSKGLQLLQSKIAVLEDLSDRTETQVQQLTALLEQKIKDIQMKIQAADKQLLKIDQSTQKSLEVAKIFQDRIPHHEILERQNTIKYVKAARLAHQGLSVDQISEQIPELSRGEIEFIAKVNKEQLMFCEDSLPEWAQAGTSEAQSDDYSDVDDIGFMPPLQKEGQAGLDIAKAFEIPKNDQESLKKLGDAFKAACEEVLGPEAPQPPIVESIASLFSVTQNMAQNFLSEKPLSSAPTATLMSTAKPINSKKESTIRSVEFPRIDNWDNLGS